MSKKILIVEDDEPVLDVLEQMLQAAGYQTESYTDGNAIFEGKFNLPDLFLVDKQLSGIDGLDLCSYLKIRDVTSTIPVVMISASPNVAILARHMGADDFIEKPFDRKTLLEAIQKHLR
jgi:DNA-binding response OmpR family regulator